MKGIHKLKVWGRILQEWLDPGGHLALVSLHLQAWLSLVFTSVSGSLSPSSDPCSYSVTNLQLNERELLFLMIPTIFLSLTVSISNRTTGPWLNSCDYSMGIAWLNWIWGGKATQNICTESRKDCFTKDNPTVVIKRNDLWASTNNTGLYIILQWRGNGYLRAQGYPRIWTQKFWGLPPLFADKVKTQTLQWQVQIEHVIRGKVKTRYRSPSTQCLACSTALSQTINYTYFRHSLAFWSPNGRDLSSLFFKIKV